MEDPDSAMQRPAPHTHKRSNLGDFSQTSYCRPCGGSRWCPFAEVSIPLPAELQHCTHETVHAPPATVFLQPRHFQIPTECLFTVVLPQNVQT